MSLLLTFLQPIYNDAPEPWQIGFQDGASPGFEGITELHDSIFFFLVVISVGVFWALGSVMINFNSTSSPIVYKYANHGFKRIIATNFILINFMHFNKISLTNKPKSINRVHVYYQTLLMFETCLINIVFYCLFILFLLFIVHNCLLLSIEPILTMSSSMLPVIFISKNSSGAKKIIAHSKLSSNTTTSLV